MKNNNENSWALGLVVCSMFALIINFYLALALFAIAAIVSYGDPENNSLKNSQLMTRKEMIVYTRKLK